MTSTVSGAESGSGTEHIDGKFAKIEEKKIIQTAEMKIWESILEKFNHLWLNLRILFRNRKISLIASDGFNISSNITHRPDYTSDHLSLLTIFFYKVQEVLSSNLKSETLDIALFDRLISISVISVSLLSTFSVKNDSDTLTGETI